MTTQRTIAIRPPFRLARLAVGLGLTLAPVLAQPGLAFAEGDAVAYAPPTRIGGFVDPGFLYCEGKKATIVGTDGYIRIPDFWRARECSLFRLDERIDHYYDGRKGGGFEFEIQSVSEDIAAGRLSSAVVPLETSLRVQGVMDRIRGEVRPTQQPAP